jgi:hypothetical protein
MDNTILLNSGFLNFMIRDGQLTVCNYEFNVPKLSWMIICCLTRFRSSHYYYGRIRRASIPRSAVPKTAAIS